MGSRAKKLLVVEDDLIDAQFVMRAFSDIGGDIEITHVADTDIAEQRLSTEHFDYVLLDINMPGTNGLELLKRIRTGDKTVTLPVIMLTSSKNPTDIYASYANGANAYAIKPSSVSGYRSFAEGFTNFWVNVAIPPRVPKPL